MNAGIIIYWYVEKNILEHAKRIGIIDWACVLHVSLECHQKLTINTAQRDECNAEIKKEHTHQKYYFGKGLVVHGELNARKSLC